MKLIYLYIVAISLLSFLILLLPQFASLTHACNLIEWLRWIKWPLPVKYMYIHSSESVFQGCMYWNESQQRLVTQRVTSLSYSLTISWGYKKKNTKLVVGTSKKRALLTKTVLQRRWKCKLSTDLLLWTWPWAKNLLISVP